MRFRSSVQSTGIGHMSRPPRHPPCRGNLSVAWWRTGGRCPSPPAPAEGVQRESERANRGRRRRKDCDGIGEWCNGQHNGLWNRGLQVRILPRLRNIRGRGLGSRTLCRGGVEERSFVRRHVDVPGPVPCGMRVGIGRLSRFAVTRAGVATPVRFRAVHEGSACLVHVFLFGRRLCSREAHPWVRPNMRTG